MNPLLLLGLAAGGVWLLAKRAEAAAPERPMRRPLSRPGTGELSKSSWMDLGIAFEWDPVTGELTARHSVGIAGEVTPTEELVGVYPSQEAAHQASLSWLPFGEG